MFLNLAAEIKRTGLTQKQFAAEIKMNEILFSKKLNGSSDWKLDEIKHILEFFENKLSFDYLFGGD